MNALKKTMCGGWICCLCMFFSIISVSTLFAQESTSANASINLSENPHDITVSKEFGHVVEAHKGEGNNLILCVRDLHIDPVAQINISNLI